MEELEVSPRVHALRAARHELACARQLLRDAKTQPTARRQWLLERWAIQRLLNAQRWREYARAQ